MSFCSSWPGEKARPRRRNETNQITKSPLSRRVPSHASPTALRSRHRRPFEVCHSRPAGPWPMPFFVPTSAIARRSGGDGNCSRDRKYRGAHKNFCSAAPRSIVLHGEVRNMRPTHVWGRLGHKKCHHGHHDMILLESSPAWAGGIIVQGSIFIHRHTLYRGYMCSRQPRRPAGRSLIDNITSWYLP